MKTSAITRNGYWSRCYVSALTKSKVGELTKMEYRTDCIKYLSAAFSKLRERSSLKYKLARASTCFAPLIILYKAQLGKIRMKDLTQLLHYTGDLKSDSVDRASLQYSDLCDMAQSSLNKQLKDFDSSKDRLDEFYISHLAEKKEFVDLFEVIKFVLVLSRGNAVVESGFSISSDVLVENLKEESVVAQRQVFDGIQSSGGIREVVITSSMMSYVRSPHSRYNDALKRKKKHKARRKRKEFRKGRQRKKSKN